MRRRAVVRVPGAVLVDGGAAVVDGHDADTPAVAVDRRLALSIETRAEAGIVVERGGTLAALVDAPDRDRIVVAFRAACEHAGRRAPDGLLVRAVSRIPVACGLGASAAAAVAGVSAASELLGLGLDPQTLVRLAAELDGSAAQVAAAVRGTTLRSPLVIALLGRPDALIASDAARAAVTAGATRVVSKGERVLVAHAPPHRAADVLASVERVLSAVDGPADVFLNPTLVSGQAAALRVACDDAPIETVAGAR